MPRPARDYEGLYQEWRATDLPRTDFLRRKGVNPASGSAFTNTRGWNARRFRDGMHGAPLSESGITTTPTAKEQASAELATLCAKVSDVDRERHAEIAAEIEAHLRLLLKGSRSSDCNGERTSLSAYEVVKLVDALADLQAIRRAGRDPRRGTDDESGLTNPVVNSGEPRAMTICRPTAYANPTTKSGRFLYPRSRLVADAVLSRHAPPTITVPLIAFVAEVWDEKQERFVRLAPRSAGS